MLVAVPAALTRLPTYNGSASTRALNAAASAAVRGSAGSNVPMRNPISSLATPLTVVRLMTSRTPRIAPIWRDS